MLSRHSQEMQFITNDLWNLRFRHDSPFHPGRHPESQIPFVLLQPLHVSLHLLAHPCPKYPCWQTDPLQKKHLIGMFNSIRHVFFYISVWLINTLCLVIDDIKLTSKLCNYLFKPHFFRYLFNNVWKSDIWICAQAN